MFGKKPYTSSSEQGSEPQQQTANALVGGEANVPAVIRESYALDKSRASSLEAAYDFSQVGQAAQQAKQRDVLKFTDKALETPEFSKIRLQLITELVDKIDLPSLQKLPVEMRKKRIHTEAGKILNETDALLTSAQIDLLQTQVIDEILGYGPLEVLLSDPDVSDIMINTSQQIYIERAGKIYLTDVKFMNEDHLMGVIQRIVTRVGRRVDEASPMVDARLPDGSRFNAIIPPLALDGALVSIRKFKKNKISLRDYVNYESMTPQMARFLEICANIRLNIIISGGTGSGKTTLLNALSKNIDEGERVITIEDAAELQMAQPHVLRLETRPASNEGAGEVTQRQLVKNALRMRPDRIILGEIRGNEVIDLLAAMNTGHDGSLATIHSNSPRDCLARIENLVNMSGVAVPESSLRYQISSAVQLIIQLQRMRDGKRRITHIEEVVGQEGAVITTQTLFSYRATGIDSRGNLQGEFISGGIRPRFLERAEYYGLHNELLECIGISRAV
jgi:pilus assembly protein CpaF